MSCSLLDKIKVILESEKLKEIHIDNARRKHNDEEDNTEIGFQIIENAQNKQSAICNIITALKDCECDLVLIKHKILEKSPEPTTLTDQDINDLLKRLKTKQGITVDEYHQLVKEAKKRLSQMLNAEDLKIEEIIQVNLGGVHIDIIGYKAVSKYDDEISEATYNNLPKEIKPKYKKTTHIDQNWEPDKDGKAILKPYNYTRYILRGGNTIRKTSKSKSKKSIKHRHRNRRPRV